VFGCLRIIALMAAIILRCGFAFADDAAFSAYDLMAGCRAYLLNNISTEDYFAAKYCAEIIDGLVGAEPGRRLALEFGNCRRRGPGRLVEQQVDLGEWQETLARQKLAHAGRERAASEHGDCHTGM